jgi:hypothetical protein
MQEQTHYEASEASGGRRVGQSLVAFFRLVLGASSDWHADGGRRVDTQRPRTIAELETSEQPLNVAVPSLSTPPCKVRRNQNNECRDEDALRVSIASRDMS